MTTLSIVGLSGDRVTVASIGPRGGVHWVADPDEKELRRFAAECLTWADRLTRRPPCPFCANDAEQCHGSMDCEARAWSNHFCLKHQGPKDPHA